MYVYQAKHYIRLPIGVHGEDCFSQSQQFFNCLYFFVYGWSLVVFPRLLAIVNNALYPAAFQYSLTLHLIGDANNVLILCAVIFIVSIPPLLLTVHTKTDVHIKGKRSIWCLEEVKFED